jgi:hypothetical protein
MKSRVLGERRRGTQKPAERSCSEILVIENISTEQVITSTQKNTESLSQVAASTFTSIANCSFYSYRTIASSSILNESLNDGKKIMIMNLLKLAEEKKFPKKTFLCRWNR